MEPVGVAASIVALIQVAGKLTALGYSYMKDVKRATTDIDNMTRMTKSFGDLLCNLMEDLGDAGHDSSILRSLRTEISECHAELASLEVKLNKHREKKGLRGRLRSLKWPLEAAENNEIIARIERYKSTFSVAMSSANLTVAKATEVHVQGIAAGMSSVHLTVQGLDARTRAESIAHSVREEKAELDEAKRKRMEVLEWFYPDPFDIKHSEICNRRRKDTGGWLLESTEFSTWESHDPQILWGYGIPGAGKTFLSSRAIDHFLAKTETENWAMAYIYFDFKQQAEQTPALVLSSLIKQLSLQHRTLPDQLLTLYNKLEHRGRKPSLDELSETVNSLVKSFERVYLVFDAMDECNKKLQRKALLPLLHSMRKSGAHIFVTSRDYPQDIRDSFRDMPCIELVASDGDIENYVIGMIADTPRIKRFVENHRSKRDLQNAIVSELIQCANGMFLLVRFHIEYLCAQTTINQLLTALEAVRSSAAATAGSKYPLDATYDRVLETINNQHKPCQELAMSIFTWLVAGNRLLTVDEIRIATSIKPRQAMLDEVDDLTDRDTILEVCAGLVTIDPVSNVVRLAHMTVHDYLVRRTSVARDTARDANGRIASSCVYYLTLPLFSNGVCDSGKALDTRLEENPFLEYVSYHLSAHLRCCNDEVAKELILHLHRSPTATCVWIQASSYLTGARTYANGYLARVFKNAPPLLHLVCFTGNRSVLLGLLADGEDLSATDDRGRGVLHWAVSSGDVRIVGILIEKGANVRHQDNSGRTVLFEATKCGEQEVVQCLLDVGVDLETRNKYGQTALGMASSIGHVAVVRLLLERGASVSAANIDSLTPLHTASTAGHEAVVNLLLDSGADVEAVCKTGDCAIHLASRGGHEAVVRILLDHDADVSPRNNDGNVPLHLASQQGREAVVSLLLDSGADVEAVTKKGDCAIHLASRGGHEEVVRILLDHDADVSPRNNDGNVPLHLASHQGREAVVSLLLDSGADVEAVTKKGDCAIHLASRGGHEVVVRILLDRGADISPRNNGGNIPLHLASENGHEAVVKLLLDSGADVQTTGNQGECAIHRASRLGREAVVRVLLHRGADPSVLDADGDSPLHSAASNGYPKIVELLLAVSGASNDTLNHKGRTPLFQAVFSQDTTVVELILAHGADPTIADAGGDTPLQYARRRKNQAIIDLLVKRSDSWLKADSGEGVGSIID